MIVNKLEVPSGHCTQFTYAVVHALLVDQACAHTQPPGHSVDHGFIISMQFSPREHLVDILVGVLVATLP